MDTTPITIWFMIRISNKRIGVAHIVPLVYLNLVNPSSSYRFISSTIIPAFGVKNTTSNLPGFSDVIFQRVSFVIKRIPVSSQLKWRWNSPYISWNIMSNLPRCLVKYANVPFFSHMFPKNCPRFTSNIAQKSTTNIPLDPHISPMRAKVTGESSNPK